jgi:hypothetical protein
VWPQAGVERLLRSAEGAGDDEEKDEEDDEEVTAVAGSRARPGWRLGGSCRIAGLVGGAPLCALPASCHRDCGVGRAVGLVGEPHPLVGEPHPLVGEPHPLVGEPYPASLQEDERPSGLGSEDLDEGGSEDEDEDGDEDEDEDEEGGRRGRKRARTGEWRTH